MSSPPIPSESVKAEDWTGDMGVRWVTNLRGLEALVAPIGDALLAQADYRPGERVLDIGCGGGSTTIAIARAVAPDGVALGIDISPDLTAIAGRRAAEAGLGNTGFLCSDAATVRLPEAPFDRLFSRFGSMFFDDPVAAFSNLHSLLRPGGRVDLAVWGPPRDNPWMMEMMTIARRHVEIPPAIPRAPGPFAFEDTDYLNEILAAAGFSAIEISAHGGPLPIGGAASTPKSAVDFAFAALAFGRALDEQSEEVRSAAAREMTTLFEKHHAAPRGVVMNGKAWLVSALAAGA
jgi:ubiquinone/menaquinone biosynthesis C-methylase UbiE